MRSGGYIRLHRSLLDHALTLQLPAPWFRIFVVILMRVNWKPGTWWYGSSKVTIPPGSMVTSVENLSQSAGSSIKQVRGCLKYLRAADIAAIRTTNRYTMITVLNWKIYQTAEEAEGKPCAKPDGEPRAESGQSDGKVRAIIKESDQGIIRERNQKDKADDSSAFRKVSEEAQESGVQFPSTLPSGRQTPLGLTPAKTIARALQGRLASFEDINSLKEEMAAIKGELPTQSAVASVLGALGDVSVTGFTQHLRGVSSRYRPGGHRAVHAWRWFTTCAACYAEMSDQQVLSQVVGTCRHGKVDGACAQCLPQVEFDRMTEALGD
jgi:hypothetical protein